MYSRGERVRHLDLCRIHPCWTHSFCPKIQRMSKVGVCGKQPRQTVKANVRVHILLVCDLYAGEYDISKQRCRPQVEFVPWNVWNENHFLDFDRKFSLFRNGLFKCSQKRETSTQSVLENISCSLFRRWWSTYVAICSWWPGVDRGFGQGASRHPGGRKLNLAWNDEKPCTRLIPWIHPWLHLTNSTI